MEDNPVIDNPQPDNSPAPEENKTIAIISYITVIGLIAAIIMNQDKKEPFGSFHIRQALGIFASGLVLSFVAVIPILGWIAAILGGILLFVLWIIGFINAITGKTKTVPVLGDKFAEWFAGVG